MTPDQPQGKKPRSRKMYILWAIALTLLLALGLFCWLVVVPVSRVRSLLGDGQSEVPLSEFLSESGERNRPSASTKDIDDVAVYLRMPNWIAPQKVRAALHLGQCGNASIPLLRELLRSRDENLAIAAAAALAEQSKHEEDAIMLLLSVLSERDSRPNLSYMAILALQTAYANGHMSYGLDGDNLATWSSVVASGRQDVPPAISRKLDEITGSLKEVSVDDTRLELLRQIAASALETMKVSQEDEQ
jgi:hypothetical protein